MAEETKHNLPIIDEFLKQEKENNKINYYLYEIKRELIKANKKHKLFSSFHEAYAVILEEWDEIKNKKHFEKLIKKECIQVAVMCLKLLTSFFDKNGEYSDSKEGSDIYLLYEKKCIKQLFREKYGGINKVICIIRKWNRKFNKEQKEFFKNDTFIRLFKKRILKNASSDLKEALKIYDPST